MRTYDVVTHIHKGQKWPGSQEYSMVCQSCHQFFRICAPVGTWAASQFGIQRLKKMILRDSTYSRQFLRTTDSGQLITLQMFAGNCRDSTGKLKCRDFKFMGITCIPAIPVIFKTHTLISIVIFEGNLILQGYYRDSLHYVQGKPCNDIIF